MPSDADAIAREEAAGILAVHVATVDRLIRRDVVTRRRKYATAQLSRDEVEHLALSTRPVRRLVAGADSYWLSRGSAADVLGVSGRPPFNKCQRRLGRPQRDRERVVRHVAPVEMTHNSPRFSLRASSPALVAA